MSETKYIDIVFEGKLGPDGPRFVEAENDKERSIRAGEWIHGEPFSRLRITPQSFNSPLIAAAPELLAAVQDFLLTLDCHGYTRDSDDLRELIAKATGEGG